MPKLAESRNTRQMFIDSFFNNAHNNAPTKTMDSDCSATKQTCATFFSGHNQIQGDKNPHFYNFESGQLHPCERLNLKISKLKSRADCARAAERIASVKNVISRTSTLPFESERYSSNLNTLGMLLEETKCDNLGRLVNCNQADKSSATDGVQKPCQMTSLDPKQTAEPCADLIANQKPVELQSVPEKQPLVTNSRKNSGARAEAPEIKHNKLMDLLKQHHHATPANAPNSNKACVETPFEVSKQALKAKNFHVYNENKVFDYQLNSEYKVGRLIGKGSFAEVRLATRISDEKLVAIKSFPNNSQGAQQTKKIVQNEIKVLKSIDHPNIVKLIDIIVSKDYMHIVLDYCDGLNLYEYMYNRGGKRLAESLARRIFIQLLDAVSYLHRNNIYHRDLKLDNIMIDRTGKVTIIDFGFAIQASAEAKITTFCGTPFYMAPEIYQRISYTGASVDLVSVQKNKY